MDNDWEKAAAYTENLIEEVSRLPLSDRIKESMLAALKCNKYLLNENYKQALRIQELEEALDRIANVKVDCTRMRPLAAVRCLAKDALK